MKQQHEERMRNRRGVSRRSSSFTNGLPVVGLMPPHFCDEHSDKDLKRDDSSSTRNLDAALQRLSLREPFRLSPTSVPSMSPRVASISHTEHSIHHRHSISNELFTIKWNSCSTKNRRRSTGFEDCNDESSHTSLEQALSLRPIILWNPHDEQQDVNQSSSSVCLPVVSKSRGRRSRRIRSGPLKIDPSKALEYMQHRSFLQQSLLRRPQQKKPTTRRRSSTQTNCDQRQSQSHNRSTVKAKNQPMHRRHSDNEFETNHHPWLQNSPKRPTNAFNKLHHTDCQQQQQQHRNETHKKKTFPHRCCDNSFRMMITDILALPNL